MHIGDVAWERAVNAGRSAHTWRTACWDDGGQVIAWGWAEGDHLSLVVDPDRAEVAADVLAWFQELAPAGVVSVLETEDHLVAALEAAGYHSDDAAPFFTHHRIPLSDLPAPVVPDGFTLRHTRPDEVEKRAAAHRAAWSDLAPSKVSDADVAAVMSTWPYESELDWIVEAPNGDFAATALIWHDKLHGIGLVEPVGCAPPYRRQGLAQAVNLAALHALREAGATDAMVCPRGDDGYPQARALYQSIGFRPGARTALYLP
ncbi:GNAT family N-acetyltransferase [Kribbella antibiotica]|uniref:GNAT family N-acetyltransferase n=2 Tax=Kribbella antibiotica TaxID=190195 RepID=A0A4R4ZL72_9ACTN|nr:GNAT family N-acetyltransferase [Kribbella antibiotica]